nr:hypothetical protein [Tanacetum cinerariifolium]
MLQSGIRASLTIQFTFEFSGPAFDEAVQRAVNALLPGLTSQFTNELRQSGAEEMVTNLLPSTPSWKGLKSRSLDPLAPQPLQLMLKNGLLISRSYLRCWDVLTSLKLGWLATSLRVMLLVGGRLLNKPREKKRIWQYCHGRTSERFSFCNISLCLSSRSPPEEKAKHFKWALCDWILDGIVNTEFTDVAQVANARRNIELLHERGCLNNKRNRDGDRIQPTTRNYNQKGACHRIIGACFSCGLTRHMAKDCPKNGRSGSKGNGNEKKLAAKGKVFSLTKDQAVNSLGTVSGTLLMNDRAVSVLFDTGATHSMISITLA